MTRILISLDATRELFEDRASALQQLAATGIDGIILDQREKSPSHLDSTAAAAWLSSLVRLPLVVTTSVGLNDPYNLARRVLSAQRAHSSSVSLQLGIDGLDSLTESFRQLRGDNSLAISEGEIWAEYVDVLRALWQSFPLSALHADKEKALYSTPARIQAINHEGSAYRVAGPLNAPLDAKGLPQIYARITKTTPREESASLIAGADSAIVDRESLEHQEIRESIAQRRQERSLQALGFVTLSEVTAIEQGPGLDREGNDLGLDGFVVHIQPHDVRDLIDLLRRYL